MNSSIEFNSGQRPILIAGPCAIEGTKTIEIAEQIAEELEGLNHQWVFKASFDKANRTASNAQRGVGLKEGLEILNQIKDLLKIPIVTDVHSPEQCAEVAGVADVLQIPAFLCRQTDLLFAAAETGAWVNIKKGQFLSPGSLMHSAKKVESKKNNQILLTERGTTFGYGNLIVDFTATPDIRYKDYPLIMDATHAVQKPATEKESTGGDWTLAEYLLRAAAANGFDGFFIETHPNPLTSPSDGPNMIPLKELRKILETVYQFYNLAKSSPRI